jgi:hypothetical protein
LISESKSNKEQQIKRLEKTQVIFKINEYIYKQSKKWSQTKQITIKIIKIKFKKQKKNGWNW